ncbi:MAG: hypothetical protein J5825_11090 [Lachnospiraceae bacterium]|nr:hypothetical protein [Lachnospiraceae bacterium]
MKNLFHSLQHQISFANKEHYLWLGAVAVILITLAILHGIWKNDEKKIRIWRLLCLLPLIVTAVHAVIYLPGFTESVTAYLPFYVIALFALLPIPFAKRKIGYRITAVITTLLSLASGLYFLCTSPLYFNHSSESYTASFHSLVRDLDRYYVLKEWKEADFSALEAKYMPMVEEAEREQSHGKFTDAVIMFCNELHDGHMYVEVKYDDVSYLSFAPPHDYGLATVLLDNGDIIAVCTDENANALGIKDGTVITKWNGKPVLQAAEEDVPDLGLSVKANADRYNALYLSGTGGDTVEVSFIDESGTEQTVTLEVLDGIHAFWDAWTAYSHYEEGDVNFDTKMLDDRCGYLRLGVEETDNGLQDILGYLTGEHKGAREMFREKLRDLKSQGMEYLVIDLRNNEGGFDVIGYALCDLLTDREWYCQGLGVRKDGKYISQCDQSISGDGEFADLKVVALTNYNCVSAGDGTSLLLSKLPNVTLAGITDPGGCDQETGGRSVLSDGGICVYFPVGPVLNENGEPNADTAADRISRDPVEERIPLDYDAAMKIFCDKEDYELEWAVQYLEK